MAEPRRTSAGYAPDHSEVVRPDVRPVETNRVILALAALVREDVIRERERRGRLRIVDGGKR